MPQTKESRALGQQLRRDGFDRSRYDPDDGRYWVRCSQCQALVINGVPCHETGCPNVRKEGSS